MEQLKTIEQTQKRLLKKAPTSGMTQPKHRRAANLKDIGKEISLLEEQCSQMKLKIVETAKRHNEIID